jgi:hypothetical protein
MHKIFFLRFHPQTPMKPANKKQGQALVSKAEDKSLKAPQSVIHIKHNVSLLQYKYWVLLLKEYREQYESGEPCDENGFRYLPMAKLIDCIGYEPKKSEIWSDLLALKNETLAFNFLEKDKTPAKYGAGFISEWTITSNRIGFKLPTFLEDVMRGLDEPRSIFQLINWNIFNQFSGKYEAVLYKLCRDYIGVGRTPYMTLQEYRDYMGLKETDYAENKELNRWVISGPIKRINESPATDILVTPEVEKKGRNLAGLYFLVEAKDKTLPPIIEAPQPPHPAFQQAKVPILPTAQQKYLALRGAEDIALCIERANAYGEKQAKDGKPPNYGALYHTAIQEGWHTALADQQAAEAEAQARKKAEAAAKRQATAQKKAQAAQGQAETEAVLGRFQALPEAAQAQALAAFLATDASAKGAYQRKGFDSPLFRFPFAQYLKAQAA